jgi:hypothetical protein
VCYNIYLLAVSDPTTRATYFGTIIVLAVYFIDQIKNLPAKEKDETVNMKHTDIVSEAQEWAKGRLTGIDIRRWQPPSVHDDGKGNVEVWGMVDRTYSQETYAYYYHKKDGEIQSDSYVKWLTTYT